MWFDKLTTNGKLFTGRLYRYLPQMVRKSVFEVGGDGSEDDGSLYSLSCEFLEAARLLHATLPTRINYSSVMYYLIGHSVELMLKAFLHRKKVSITQLKNMGHNIEQLVALTRERGLPEKVSLPYVLQLATFYKDKNFEYRKRSKKTFPDLNLLMEEVDSLSSVVFDSICS